MWARTTGRCTPGNPEHQPLQSLCPALWTVAAAWRARQRIPRRGPPALIPKPPGGTECHLLIATSRATKQARSALPHLDDRVPQGHTVR